MATELFKLIGTISINTEAATQSISAVITEGEGLEAKLKELGEKADSRIGSKSGFNAASIWLGNMLSTLTTKAVELGSAIWKAGYSFTTDLESWTMTFKTYMNGDMEAAQAFVEELRQFAYDTPLSISDVMSSAAKLMASGVDHDQVIETMWMLGDLANGNTELMSRIAYAYGQIVTAGKMQGNDPRQLKEAFVPIYKMLEEYYQAEGLDYDLSSLMDLQAAGEITAEDVYNAFKKATGPEGQWYNAMNNQMETTAGKMEKLEDAYTMASASLIQSFTEIMKAETLEKLTASFDKFIEWADKNPDVLDSLAQALSSLATTGLEVLLGSLQNLLTFWNNNQDLFNGMLVLLGGLAIKSGQFAAGAALITAGGYNIWDDWVKENQKEFSGLTSDVDLPFIRQQLEYQGKADQWEAYLESWKNARKGEGYSDEDIAAFIEKQFEGYTPLTAEQLANVAPGGEKDNKQGLFEMLASFFGNGSDDDGETGQYNDPNFFTFDYDPNFGQDKDFFTYDDVLDGVEGDGVGGSTGGAYIIGALQQVLSSWKSEITAAVKEGATEGVSGITVNGYITTGDVKLDKDTIVGELAPSFDLKLGQAESKSNWG